MVSRRHILRPSAIGFAAALCCAGCAPFPRSTQSASPQSAPASVVPAAASAAALPAGGPATATSPSTEFATILSEVQELGASDPQAQNALLDAMKRTDPTLWPQLVQTYRSSLAYRQQSEQRRLAAQQDAAAISGSTLAATPQGSIRQTGYADGELRPGAILVNSLPGASTSTPSPLPPTADVTAVYPDTHLPEVSLVSANRAGPPAIPTAAAAPDWHDQIQTAIRTLEAKMAAEGSAAASASDQANLRLLYLAAGWPDDATKPLDGVPAADREFWREELVGLATVLDDHKIQDSGRRAADAARHLQTAALNLSQSAPLAVRNPAFCTEVTSFGVIKPFAKYEFRPGQEVLLYAELENFASDATDKGYHTAMHSSYQIFDSRGAKVAEQDYAMTEEFCRNARRDYFLRYFVYLPKHIQSGNYTLQLTIEDALGKKAGQTSIQFAIAGAD